MSKRGQDVQGNKDGLGFNGDGSEAVGDGSVGNQKAPAAQLAKRNMEGIETSPGMEDIETSSNVDSMDCIETFPSEDSMDGIKASSSEDTMDGTQGNWADTADAADAAALAFLAEWDGLATMFEETEVEDFETQDTGVNSTDPSAMESSDPMEAGPSTAPDYPIIQARSKGPRSHNPRHTSPTKSHPAQSSGFLNNIDPNTLNGTNNQQNASVPSTSGFQFGSSTQSTTAAPPAIPGGRNVQSFRLSTDPTPAPVASQFSFTPPNGAPTNKSFGNDFVTAAPVNTPFGSSTQSTTAAPSTSGFQSGSSTQPNVAAPSAIPGGRNVQSFRLSTDPTLAPAASQFSFTPSNGASTNTSFGNNFATSAPVNTQFGSSTQPSIAASPAFAGGRNVQSFRLSTDPTPAPVASQFSFTPPNGASTNTPFGNNFATSSAPVNTQPPPSSFQQTSHSIDVETEMSEAMDHAQEQQAPVSYNNNDFSISMNGYATNPSQFIPQMNFHPTPASQVESSSPSIMDQLTGTTAPQSQPQVDSQPAPAILAEMSAPAYDARATLMPPEIPNFLSESQKRQFVTGYRFKSLLVSLFTQVKNPSEPLDIEVFKFYEEKKREIIAAQGLPAAISLKRMASDDGRADTLFKRVNTDGPVIDDVGASRPTFSHQVPSHKRTLDTYRSSAGFGLDGAGDDDSYRPKTVERLADYGNSKKARTDAVSYPPLPSTQTSQTADLFENVSSASTGTVDSRRKKSTTTATAKRPIVKLRGTTTPSTHSDESEPPQKRFNPWSLLKLPPVAEPAIGAASKDPQPSKASGQDHPPPAPEPSSGNQSLFQSKAGGNVMSSQPSTSTAGLKSTLDIPAKLSNSSLDKDAPTTAAPAPPAPSINFTPASTTKPPDISVPSTNAFGSTGATERTKPTGFQVPKFGATSGTNFMAQFGEAAKKTEEESAKEEKAKRKADEFDSEEDDEAEWEKKYEAEQRAKRQKIQEAKKAGDFKFVPGTGTGPAKGAPEKASSLFQFKPAQAAPSQAPEKASPLFQFKPTQAASSQAPKEAPKIFDLKPTPAATSSSFGSTKATGSVLSAQPQIEKPSKPFQFKPTQPTSSGVFGATKAVDSVISAQPQSGKPSTLFSFKPTQPTSNGTSGTGKAENSLVSAAPPSTSQPQTENIFGHLSNQVSDAEEGKADDAESEESDEDEPLPIPKPQASFSTPDQVNDTSNSSSRSTSKSLFDRIETNADGTPKHEIPPPREREVGEKAKSLTNPKTFMGETPASTSESMKSSFFAPANTVKTSNIFGQPSKLATASNSSQSISSNSVSSNPPSSGPQLDRTWKNDSPIKFNNTNKAPSLSVTGPSPTKTPSTEQKTGSWIGLFGSPKADMSASPFKPSSGLFGTSSSSIPGTAVGFNFGGPSKPLTGLAAPSVFSSAATSRATSPGVSTGGESGNEDDAPVEEQLNLANARAGEENEDILFEARARARECEHGTPKDKDDWIVRGTGQLRVLKHRETNKARIVLRVDSGGKIVLNTALMSNAAYKLARDKAVIFVAAKGDGLISKWMISVADQSNAKKLAEVLEENKFN